MRETASSRLVVSFLPIRLGVTQCALPSSQRRLPPPTLSANACHVAGVTFTNTNKRLAIEAFAAALESSGVVLLDPDACPEAAVQMRELMDYQAERTPMGNIRYNAPAGKHDDMAVAVFSAYQMAREGTGGRGAKVYARVTGGAPW